MSDSERPDPDALLARMKREEARSTRGKLKIFFGMSPGVGKTYAMLQAARQKQAEACEVVVGIVETQGNRSVAGGNADYAANADRLSRNKARGDGSRHHPHLASRSRGCR